MTKEAFIGVLIVIIVIVLVMMILCLWHSQKILDAWAADQAYWVERVKELSK